jgi:uncharacterized membrane protein (DUF485 family)
MDQHKATDWGSDRASAFKTRIGLMMFILYGLVYIGFVLLNTFDSRIMASVIGRYNLAVVYGFGLIIFALMLAAVYNGICGVAEEELNSTEEAEKTTDSETDHGKAV